MENEADREPPLPIPLPDLKVVEDMQLAIAMSLADIRRQKAEGLPIAWCSVLAPKEILFSMDVATMYGNVLGAYSTIFGHSAKYCQAAEDEGISRDVCSVARCSLGVLCCDDRDEFFESAYAEPDIVIGSTFPCMTESKTFVNVARRFNKPSYVIDVPLNTWGDEIPQYAIKYVAGQLQGLIDFLVAHGYRFDMDKLKEEVAFTKKLNALLEEIEKLKMAVPHPIKAFDNVIAMTTPLAIQKSGRDYGMFERLRDQLRERVEAGIGIVEHEKLRLLWLGLPPLFNFPMLNYPERHGAVVVKSLVEFLVGFHVPPDLLDPERPLESIALAHLASPANPPSRRAVDYFVKVAKDYQVDGVVSVIMRSCGLVPGMQRQLKEAIYRETGVPTLMFDLDGGDQREYDDAAVKSHLDAFVETLLARKGG